MLMTFPEPWPSRCVAALRMSATGAITLTSNTRRHSSCGMLTNDPAGAIPALFTTMSRPPNCSRAAGTSAATSAGSVRSQRTGWIDPGADASSSSSSSVLRAAATTRTPSATSPIVMARPRPRLAPVTIATAPSSCRSTSRHLDRELACDPQS